MTRPAYPPCQGCEHPASFLRGGFCLRCLYDIRSPNEFRTEMREMRPDELVVALADLKAMAERIAQPALGALIAGIIEAHLVGEDKRLALALGRLQASQEERREIGAPAMAEVHPALRRNWDRMKGRP